VTRIEGWFLDPIVAWSGRHPAPPGRRLFGTRQQNCDLASEIVEVIRWFGERGKIFNVHFRNIKGRKLDFMEAFPDEGDMNMPRSLAAYRNVGYRYMVMPVTCRRSTAATPPTSPSPIATATSRRCSTRSCHDRDRSRHR
jgi:D-mannonate dehydratase (UxuA)